ncbi:MAG: hypothetical protein A2173_01320 [Planctomycetes bacterium RBG_13_44_8b]|nr:MAG: hypothetical protein A2173_01320 [Planctomycetes bacterium RBG_13_44_8b]
MGEIIKVGIGKLEYEHSVAVTLLVSSIGFRLRLKRRFTLNATDTSCATYKRITKLNNAPYNCKERSTKRPIFMQNKANLRKSQVNVNLIIARDYEKKSNRTLGENKPNQSQF